MFQSMTKNDFRLTFSLMFISGCDSTAETLVLLAYGKFHMDTLKAYGHFEITFVRDTN